MSPHSCRCCCSRRSRRPLRSTSCPTCRPAGPGRSCRGRRTTPPAPRCRRRRRWPATRPPRISTAPGATSAPAPAAPSTTTRCLTATTWSSIAPARHWQAGPAAVVSTEVRSTSPPAGTRWNCASMPPTPWPRRTKPTTTSRTSGCGRRRSSRPARPPSGPRRRIPTAASPRSRPAKRVTTTATASASARSPAPGARSTPGAPARPSSAPCATTSPSPAPPVASPTRSAAPRARAAAPTSSSPTPGTWARTPTTRAWSCRAAPATRA